MFVVDDIAIAAAAEVATEVAVEVGTEIAAEVATEVATEAATEVATEMATEVASEMATEVATDVVSDLATETASEMASEGMTELASEASNEMVTDAISNLSPESLVNQSDLSSISETDTFIIGDNIGEVGDMTTLDTSTDGITEIEGNEVGDIFTEDLSNSANSDTSECANTEVGENIEESPRSIKTINDGLAGQNHPETGVPYVEKEVVTDTGEKVKGVFPQFESKVDIQLPEDLQQAPDRTQFAECNKQLQEKVANDPELRSQFTEDQLADIEDGYTPEGYTWHHNEEIGKMQLVDTDIHSQTRHTGGRNIWGGGTENRH